MCSLAHLEAKLLQVDRSRRFPLRATEGDMAVEWLAEKAKLALGVSDAEWERATTCEGADKPGKLLVTGGSTPDVRWPSGRNHC